MKYRFQIIMDSDSHPLHRSYAEARAGSPAAARVAVAAVIAKSRHPAKLKRLELEETLSSNPEPTTP